MSALLLAGKYWYLLVIVALGGALGVQTIRLEECQGEYAYYRLEQETQERERATEYDRKVEFDKRNKRRTDAEYRVALRNAEHAAASLRGVTATLAETVTKAIPSGSGDQPTVCFGTVTFAREVAGYMERLAGRLADVAQEGEALAAAYRACREWALEQGSPPPESAPSSARPGSGVVETSASLSR